MAKFFLKKDKSYRKNLYLWEFLYFIIFEKCFKIRDKKELLYNQCSKMLKPFICAYHAFQ